MSATAALQQSPTAPAQSVAQPLRFLLWSIVSLAWAFTVLTRLVVGTTTALALSRSDLSLIPTVAEVDLAVSALVVALGLTVTVGAISLLLHPVATTRATS